MRQVAQALHGVLGEIHHVCEHSIGLTAVLILATKQLELEDETPELLADVVMQFAGYARALFLLLVKQSSAKVLDPVVARAQLRLAAA
jgi:hypothetical protein